MRPVALLLVLVALAPIAHAAEVRFFTEHSKIFTGQSISVFVENLGDDIIRNIKVDIQLSPDLYFSSPASVIAPNWTCQQVNDRKATCSASWFAPRDFAGVFVETRPVDSEGGHHSVSATLTADNLPRVEPIVFDVVSGRYNLVTNASDFGAGSLRAAIEDVNAHPLCGTDVPCLIGFMGPMTIAPATPLPPIRKCNVHLGGPDFLEFPRATKVIVISGQNAAYGNGLEIRAACAAGVPGVIVSSIVVNSWPWNGIYLEAPAAHAGDARHEIARTYVGTDADGTLARPNGSRGIVTDSPHEAVWIYSSIVSGNGRSGIALFRGKSALIGGSRIGASRTGEPLGNGASGVFSFGVPMSVSGNTIAYNAHPGVAIDPSTTAAYISSNTIHSNGGLPVDWGLDERTPPDDETGRIPNAPRILDAFYDASSGTTIVRGTVRLRGGNVFTIEAYYALTPRGDIGARVPINPPRLSASAADVEFQIAIAGDQRGKRIALQTHVALPDRSPHSSSEISEAVAVR